MLRMLTRSRVRLAVRLKEKHLRLEDYGLRCTSWAAEMLKYKCEVSVLRRMSEQDADIGLSFLRVLSKNITWQKVANIGKSDVTTDDLVTAFVSLENVLSTCEYSDYRRYRASAHLRKWIRDYAIHAEIPKADLLTRMYRTRFVSTCCPKAMISEWTDLDAPIPQPIGAISFQNARDLKRLQNEKVATTLSKIEACAAKQLHETSEVGMRLNQLEEELPEIGAALYSAYTKFALNPPKSGPANTWVMERPLLEVVSAWTGIWSTAKKTGIAFVHCPRSKEVAEFLAARLAIPARCSSPHQMILYPELGNQMVALACLILIQRHTGWNASAVLELRHGRFNLSDQPVMIQGFKGKTGEVTPPVEVSDREQSVLAALTFLDQRLHKLKELGWVSREETSLWINGTFARGKAAPREYQSWNQTLKVFQAKFSLPSFSLDQLRTEVLVSEMAGGGLDAAMRMGGHTSISTTATYLDQLMLMLTNSAVLLEFERRLEANVRYLGMTTAGRAAEPLDQANDLLYPVGDGSSCTNPARPPLEDYLSGGSCSARNCHSGDGCPNRRIRLDENRLEELIRTEAYYRREWRVLLDENPDEFDRYHLPAALFSVGLIHIVERSAHRGRLKSVRQKVESAHGQA
jgi:hypothetical protein